MKSRVPAGSAEKTSELTMKSDGPRLRLRAVAFGFLLLLVPGQGEAPAQGDIGTGVGRTWPNSAEAVGVGGGGGRAGTGVGEVGAAGALQYQNREPTHLCVPRGEKKSGLPQV